MPIFQNNRASSFDRLLNQFAAQKKKSFIAIALVGLMVFMWVKVLADKGPRSASAVTQQQNQRDIGKQSKSIELKYIELPQIHGRHDTLVHDFFRMEGDSWGVKEEVSLVSDGGNRQKVMELAEKLSLEAISMGLVPEAFINDKLVKAGEEVVVNDGSSIFEFEILKIEENVVFVKYDEVEFELKLKQQNEILD
jgi:hypothetical protein